MRYRILLSLVTIGLFSALFFSEDTFAGNASATLALTVKNPTAKPDIRYKKALLTARIDRVPLAKVAHELAVNTGVRSQLNDPTMADELVSVFIDAMPLEAGIKEIFAGFSYALRRTADGYVVIVLSTPPRLSMVKTRLEPNKQTGSVSISDETLDNLDGAPRSLDEFQTIVEDEPEIFDDDDGEAIDSSTLTLIEQEQNMALQQRALDVLQSTHKHLHMQAIEELTALKDPAATEALAETATRGGMDTETRIQIVQALWQLAVDRDSVDATALDELKKLAKDRDKTLSSIARQALTNLQQM